MGYVYSRLLCNHVTSWCLCNNSAPNTVSLHTVFLWCHTTMSLAKTLGELKQWVIYMGGGDIATVLAYVGV